MRIAIIAQEEPVYFSPFFIELIKARKKDVVLVVIAGDRGAGSHPKTFKQKLENIYILWLLLEPYGFIRNLFIMLTQKFFKLLGPVREFVDKRSVEVAAKRNKIPVIYTQDLNSLDFVNKLKEFSLDVVINQTEMLLKSDILAVPKKGIVNRHASLLPHFRGRLGSFWSHTNQPPEYAVTIHFVNKDIDAGDIILQKQFEIDSKSSYTKVLDLLFFDAVNLMLEALGKIEDPNFVGLVNNYVGTKIYLFPTLKDIKEYRRILKERRKK